MLFHDENNHDVADIPECLPNAVRPKFICDFRLVIFALVILSGFFFSNEYYLSLYRMQSTYIKACQDCDTIAQAVQKFNSLETEPCQNIIDLKGKYLT